MPNRWNPGCNCCDEDVCDIVASFTYVQASFNRRQFTFTDTSTSSCNIISWLWDFGDGNTSTEQNPEHTYDEFGTYIVRLTVTDDCGCVDDVTDILFPWPVCFPCDATPPEITVIVTDNIFAPKEGLDCNWCEPGAVSGQYILKTSSSSGNPCRWNYSELIDNCLLSGCTPFDPNTRLYFNIRAEMFSGRLTVSVGLEYAEDLDPQVDCVAALRSFQKVLTEDDCTGVITLPNTVNIRTSLCEPGTDQTIDVILNPAA